MSGQRKCGYAALSGIIDSSPGVVLQPHHSMGAWTCTLVALTLI